MRASPIKTSFNAGELSPLLDGRIDIDKYANALKTSENMLPLVQGPVIRRAGTRFVAEAKGSVDALYHVWLAKFEFNYQQSFVLEFGPTYIRFYYNRGQLVTGTVAAWSNATAYEAGQLASRLGVNYYCKVAHTNHQPPNATYWYPLTDDIYEVPTQFSASDLTNDDGCFGLSIVQSADVLYIAAANYLPQKLSRFDNLQWVLEQVNITGGPFDAQNTDESITVYASAQTGTVTLTASSDVFSDYDLTGGGGLFYLHQNVDDDTLPWEANKSVSVNDIRSNDGKNYVSNDTGTTGYVSPIHTVGTQYDGDGGVRWGYSNSQYAILNITAVGGGGTTATADVIGDEIPYGAVGSGQASWVWRKSAWVTQDKCPTIVTFFRQRLVFASNQSVWFSAAGDYENFNSAEFGEVLADSAFTVEVNSTDTSEIKYLAPTKQGLIVGTSSGEVYISESTTTDVFGPLNYKVSPSSGWGGRQLNPVKIDDTVMFMQRAGKKLRETVYDFSVDNFSSTDVTVLSEHVTQTGIIDMAFAKSPYSIIWMVRSDGVLAAFTYDKAQNVRGWHRHIIGGSFDDGTAVVESVQVISSPDGSKDDLWMCVKRTIDGNTVRYIEYMEKEYETGDEQSSCFYVDSGLTYDGVPADTISGLDHLEGETVDVLVDGGGHPQCVVAGGEITLQYEGSVVQVGLPYTPLVQTMRMEAGAADGTAQGKTKRINQMVIRLYNSQAVQVGGDGTNYDDIIFRSPSTPMGTPEPLFTGDKVITWNQGYDLNGYVYVTQNYPLPLTLIALMPQVSTYDRG